MQLSMPLNFQHLFYLLEHLDGTAYQSLLFEYYYLFLHVIVVIKVDGMLTVHDTAGKFHTMHNHIFASADCAKFG